MLSHQAILLGYGWVGLWTIQNHRILKCLKMFVHLCCRTIKANLFKWRPTKTVMESPYEKTHRKFQRKSKEKSSRKSDESFQQKSLTTTKNSPTRAPTRRLAMEKDNKGLFQTKAVNAPTLDVENFEGWLKIIEAHLNC